MIDIFNLSKAYDNTLAVNGVSLTIEKGSLFGLLGPNGAGKTSLINVLCGLIPADRGEIRMAGIRCKGSWPKDIRSRFGLVPQELAFYENYSARDNVRFFASLYGLRGSELARASDEALSFAGLEDCGKKAAKSFSGGMKRRLNIACGIVHRPQIVIMDEPTVGIDPQSRNHILSSIEALHKRGITIIYTTHYMEEAERLCSRIAIMDKGTIIAQGSRDELKLLVRDVASLSLAVTNAHKINIEPFKAMSGVKQVLIKENTMTITSDIHTNNLPLIMAEALRQKLVFTSICSENPSLEDVFLDLTGRSLRD